MIKTEYVRNLNCNYTRIFLEEHPDEKRYQYCILNRGGMKYLLPCTCRNIDGESYLYYDIVSVQNIRQRFERKCIQREWMKEFLWGMRMMMQELNRFLLDSRNIVWNPEHIFQDLEKNDFRYIYIPYYGQEDQSEEKFDKLLEFWVDKVDYDDELLVQFVFQAYEQYMNSGESYLEKQIYEDFEKINVSKISKSFVSSSLPEKESEQVEKERVVPAEQEKQEEVKYRNSESAQRKSIFSFWEGRKKKQEQHDDYRNEIRRMINGYAVCEDTEYRVQNSSDPCDEEEYGRTIYVEEQEELIPALYSNKGERLVQIEKFPFVMGKKKEEVDYVLSDYSSSRVHARLLKEEDGIYIEDMNSTNGTFKNGLRLQPYEKRKLESEDSLRLGKSIFIYKSAG